MLIARISKIYVSCDSFTQPGTKLFEHLCIHEGDEDYYGNEGPEVDHCSQYDADDDDGAREQCSHANFPEQDEIPGGAMRCCGDHRYRKR